MKKLLILTEAGDNIGFGHYMRCSAIQQEARKQGIDTEMCLFVNGNYELAINGRKCNWLEDKSILKQYPESSTLLIDSYIATENHYSFFKENFKNVAVIDDYNRITYNADILINPNPYFDKIDYSNQNVKSVGGKDFTIFREAFRKKPGAYNPGKNVKNLLVTIGGTDFREILPQIIEAGLQSGIPNITVVSPDLTSANSEPRIRMVGQQTAEEMWTLYNWADVVIAGCGQTLHELALLGKPAIGICLDIDQKLNQEYYLEKYYLQEKINWDDTNLGEKIIFSLNNFSPIYTRGLLKNFSPSLVNVSGIENIISTIQNQLTVTFRRAMPEDAGLYFNWVNDAEVRNNSITTGIISWETHQQWFSEKISSESLMLVFFLNEEPFGQLRIDWENDGGWIDYSIDNRFRGLGLGKIILREAIELLNRASTRKKISGKVKIENLASKRCFEKSGFSLESTISENGNESCIYSYNN